jgi:molybdopterin synthase sulfur carrier subunit
MSEINVLTFGVVREIIGKNSFVLNDVSSTEELKNKLESDFPQLRSINYAMAVNKKMVSGSTPLEDRATIALLPPFSGG